MTRNPDDTTTAASPLDKACGEMLAELEHRAVEAAAMAEVYPEIAEERNAQVAVLAWATYNLRTKAGRAALIAGHDVILSAFIRDNRADIAARAQSIRALGVEIDRQEKAHG